MLIVKRDGTREGVQFDKILRAVTLACEGLSGVDPVVIAKQTIAGLHDGATTRELDEQSIAAAVMLMIEEPTYSRVAARLLSRLIAEEVGLTVGFGEYMREAVSCGLVSDQVLALAETDMASLLGAMDEERDGLFEYFGLKTVYDRYLLRHRDTRRVMERPQWLFMRVALGLSETIEEAIALYELISTFRYMPATPTLFNAGTRHPQMSSCYLLTVGDDSLEGIYKAYADCARLSKWAGGIGIDWTPVRATGAPIKGNNGTSSGLVPFLKVLDSSVHAVNQCFAPDTLVHTTDGPRPIDEIQVGDLVLGQMGKYREVTERFSYQQYDRMVEIDVKHAITPIRVTAGHPVWALRGVPLEQSGERTYAQLASGKLEATWVEAGELQAGDYVAQTVSSELAVVPGFTEDDARLYGILLGDGHLDADDYEWGVSGNPQRDEHLRFVRAYLSGRGIHFWETQRGDSYLQIRWATGHGVKRDASSGRITGAGEPTLPLSRKDLYNDDGMKRIARRLAHLPAAQTWALIQGLVETDGCVSRETEITFTNTSCALIEGLRYQLLRMGVPTAGQYREREQRHTGRRSDGSTLEINGVTRAYDVRIPAVEELATRLGIRKLTKFNWIRIENWVFTRVKTVREIAPVPVVFDLKVDGDETYTTTSMLVHNGGKRKGAAAIYLQPWHADIEAFLELRQNTGAEERRTHHLNLALWVPDLFMKRVEADGVWSLFCPSVAPELLDSFGQAFEAHYERLEADGKAFKQVSARTLYARMLQTLAETGNGWMCFKDTANARSAQTGRPGAVIRSSNLCTEILEVTSASETAVCNLGSINLSVFVTDGKFDFEALRRAVRTVVPFLDRVIDRNFYPTPEAAASNARWRPVGLGMMGLQDALFQLRLPFASDEARALSNRIAEIIYFEALSASVGRSFPAFGESRYVDGTLQMDLAAGLGHPVPELHEDWDGLREAVKTRGIGNSLLVAIAPTATIASIVGATESIEPLIANVFKRETLSGEFVQVNRYLVRDLQARGLWDATMQGRIVAADGSVAAIPEVPEDLKALYRTAWELPQKALVDMAAERSAFICQGQSLNLFMEEPSLGKLSSMYMYAWKQGLKTTYYLRSRAKTKIQKTTVQEAAIACSLESPESCEACT